MFQGISVYGASAMSIPATYATGYGFIWAFGCVIHAMAESKLFPVYLQTCTTGPDKVPYMALLTGCGIGYAICVTTYFIPGVDKYIFNVCILSGFMAYVSQFYGYFIMKTRHASQEREFKSPLGLTGAFYGAIVFIIAAISVMGFQRDGHTAFLLFLGQVVICSLYYYFYARNKQCFSDDEKFVFLTQLVKCKLSHSLTLS
jgi:L-asparagine transporter-like permease